MKLEELILFRYKRLMLSNIQRVELRPNSVLQLIVGSNGAGKSSIMDELTPLPAHHAAFEKGGFKGTKWSHRGSSYVLESHYDGGSGRHSFVKDNEELNKGGTFAVQLELCKSEFQLTRKIHEILTGSETFTSMSTARRREVLTMLTPVDLGYVFERYGKIKTEHRDALAIIRHSAKRMTGENHDLPDDAEMARLRTEIGALTEKLNDLFLNRIQGAEPGFRSEGEIYSQLDQLIAHGKKLLVTHCALAYSESLTTRVQYDEELNDQISQHRSMQAVIEQLVEELEKARKQAPSKDANLSADEIAALRVQMQDQLELSKRFDQEVQAYAGVFPLVPLDTSGDPMHRLNGVFDRWMDLLSTFPSNEDGRMNSADARTNSERLKVVKQEYRGIDDKVTVLSRRLANLRGCAEVVCPKCTHSFKPGIGEDEGLNLEVQIDQLAGLGELCFHEQEQLTRWLEEYDTYASFVYRFRTLTEDYPQFNAVWEYCGAHKVMYRLPRTYTTALVDWVAAMRAKVQRDQAASVADVLRNKLQYVEAIDQDAAGYLDRLQHDLEQNIETRTHEAVDHRRQTLKLQESGQRMIRLEEQLTRLIEDFEHYGAAVQKHGHYLIQRAFEEETRITQLNLANNTRTLSAMEQREHTLRNLEREHAEATELYADFGLMVKALSPTDGVIGRYLRGFMESVVQLMNATIGEIWTYPMEVLPSKIDKDELDYNFPLDVNGGAVVAPDIAKGSSSQRDIVNFAFKLVVMKALHFEDYPLYLDEFGSTFDEAHRERLIPFVARLIELGQVKQVFFISHFSSMHGAFNQAEIMVLDPTNIVVPQVYNQHVVLE